MGILIADFINHPGNNALLFLGFLRWQFDYTAFLCCTR